MSLKFGRIADRPKSFLAVDPGVKYFAWALVRDGVIVDMGLHSDSRYLANRFPGIDTAVVERARVHRGQEKKKVEVEGLLIAAGEIAGQFPNRVYGLQTLPKSVFQARTRAVMYAAELDKLETFTKKNQYHIVDACGYAMKYLGRM